VKDGRQGSRKKVKGKRSLSFLNDREVNDEYLIVQKRKLTDNFT